MVNQQVDKATATWTDESKKGIGKKDIAITGVYLVIDNLKTC